MAVTWTKALLPFAGIVFVHVLVVHAEGLDMTVGDIALIPLTRSSFFKNSELLKDDPVRYIPSASGKPGLPSWLVFLQRNGLSDGYLYGTPRSVGDTSALEVVAVNERTYQAVHRVYDITIRPSDTDFSQLNVLEIWIQNFNVEEILKEVHISYLTQRLKKMWQSSSDLFLVKVASIPSVTGRFPVPSESADEIKDGVILQFGSGDNFSKKLKSTLSQVQDGRCDTLNTDDIKLDGSKRFSDDYKVNWCHFKLVEAVMQTTAPDVAPLVADAVPWIPRSAGIERRDLFLEFILTVIVPLALGLLMFVILSVLMFGRREGREKRDRQTSETQLMQFQSIRQATCNLRYMSAQRDGLPTMTPRLGRTPAGTPGPSTVNTLSRPDRIGPRGSPPPTQPPPPYRPPPTFPTDGSMGATGWQRNLQPIAMATHDEPMTDDEQLVPPGSPETLKVRK